MKLIKQSFEFINQKDFSIKGIEQFIERCARVSYKSEDRITEDSYTKFVSMLKYRDHARPLEFGTVHLKMHYVTFYTIRESIIDKKLWNDQWIKYNEVKENDSYFYYITTNYRYYLDICKGCYNLKDYLDENDSECYPKRYTVHMILNRGIMDEFRTHVGLSHLAESTRYVNYSRDKFGNELTFIIPYWSNAPEGEYSNVLSIVRNTPKDGYNAGTSALLETLLNTESCYFKLLSEGLKPQQARETLPLSIKSELISCGFEDAWSNFLRRRSLKYGDLGAHPMAAEIADKLYEELYDIRK